MKIRKAGRILFFVSLALSLIYIWYPHYFLTNDGPTHVYNARILHDLWSNPEHTSFYQFYYTLVTQPNPNWLSHLLLAALMFITSGLIAEKLLITIYLALFVTGYVQLLRKLSGDNGLWPLFIFVFVFNHASAFGFYNFSLALALYAWVVWAFILMLEQMRPVRLIVLGLLLTLLFFAHLLLFVIDVFTMACLAVSMTIANGASHRRQVWRTLLRNFGTLVFFVAPFALIAGRFSEQQGGLGLQLKLHSYRLLELLQLKFVVNLSEREVIPELVAGCMLAFICGLTLMDIVKSRGIRKYDGFLVAAVGVFVVYLCFPDVVFGKQVMLSFRMQIVLGLVLLCVVAARYPGGIVVDTVHFLAGLCFLILCVVRITSMKNVSERETELLSSADHIKSYSVVLPLNFAPGRDIPERQYPFIHAADLLGDAKPLIVLDNYEPSTGFFPLRWTEKVNPYKTPIVGHGIETAPPHANIPAWEIASGRRIDYVLMWCYDPAVLADTGYQTLDSEIHSLYTLKFTSTGGRAMLWERKP